MIWNLILLIVGGALLLGGGDLLVRGASGLARSLGVRPVVIGLTVVAFGTSAPELVVNLIAAFTGRGGIAFGNVVGSNLANLGLILGLGACVRPLAVEGSIIVREIPLMLLATVAVIVMTVEGDFSGVAGSIDQTEGLCLLLFFVVFLYALAREVLTSRTKDALALQIETSPVTKAPDRRAATIGMIAVGLVGLVLGGHLLVTGASALARGLGVSEVVIGLSIVAVGTSLPELVTSIIAALRGEADIAVGNVVGSNIFNLLFVLGVTTSLSPIDVPAGGFVDLLAALVVSSLLLPFAITGQRRIVRAEGAVLLAAWIGYTGWRCLPSG